jgi:hypothetical protein
MSLIFKFVKTSAHTLALEQSASQSPAHDIGLTYNGSATLMAISLPSSPHHYVEQAVLPSKQRMSGIWRTQDIFLVSNPYSGLVLSQTFGVSTSRIATR